MKNPFRFFHAAAKDEPTPKPDQAADQKEQPAPEEPVTEAVPNEPVIEEAQDSFIEWCRTQVRGEIERRERNDIYEAYSVFGTDNGQLICRFYHRYPEHERDFDLSYSRQLSFDEFNRRLLSELDKGDLKLSAYNECIEKAASQNQTPPVDAPAYDGFTEEESAALRAFCDSMDTLTDKEYRGGDGIFHCSCRSVVGEERLNLRFRKPLPHDALSADIPGVGKKSVEGYDIDDLWIMGIHNRLSERCDSVRITLLTAEWSLSHESVYLMAATGFPGIEGTLLLAVADEAAFPRFGFYSLDFSKK